GSGGKKALLFLRRETFRQSDGLEHRFRFVHGLLKFRFRLGVVDPAAAGLHVGFAVLDERRADGDAAVEVAVEREIADTTAVRSARRLLKFGNDLHRADLWRASERAGGKRC